MNFFIFGGSGFIGKHLINELRHSFTSCSIYNLDIEKEDHRGQSTYVFCDVRQPIQLNIAVSSNDVIVNLAAIHRTPGHPDLDYFETNIKGAENICDFARKHNIRQIVFTSSIAPYGASEDLKEEKTLPTPNTPYGISKLIAEKIHHIWQAEEKSRSLLILRPGVVFGKGENGNFSRLYWAIKRGSFLYPGRKDTIKACIYVKDLVGFIRNQLIQMDKGEYCELFNCAYFPSYSIEEINNNISEVTCLKKPKFVIPGSLLKVAASLIGMLGGKAIGIHPDRVKKLMISTNISGEKLSKSGFELPFGLKKGIQDWFEDNNKHFLK